MSKYLDRWVNTLSGPVDNDVPDELMALALELDRRMAAEQTVQAPDIAVDLNAGLRRYN